MIRYICSTEITESYGHPWFRYGGDFFDNYFRILEQLIEMEQIHRTEEGKLQVVPYVDWSKSFFVDDNNIVQHNPHNPNSSFLTKKHNPWYNWFINNTKQSAYVKDIAAASHYELKILKHDGEFWRNDNPLIHFVRKIDKKHNILRPNIYSKINKFYNENLRGSKTLGVIANFSQDRMQNLETSYELSYKIETTKRILKQRSDINKVFLVTNDDKSLEKFLKEIPNIVYCDVFRRSARHNSLQDNVLNFWAFNPYWWADTVRSNHGIILGEENLIQAHLMAKCNIVFSNRSYFLNAVMLFNENIEQILEDSKSSSELDVNKKIAKYCNENEYWELQRNQWLNS